MSEFSSYLLVQGELAPICSALLKTSQLAIAAPNAAGWTVVVCEDQAKVLRQLRGVALRYVYAEDHGLVLTLHQDGTQTGSLEHGETREGVRFSFDSACWVDARLLSERDAQHLLTKFADLRSSYDWQQTRDIVAHTLKFRPVWASPRLLKQDSDIELFEFAEGLSPEAKLIRGGREVLWNEVLEPARADEGLADLRKLREIDAARARLRDRTRDKGREDARDTEEMRELSAAFAVAADPVMPPRPSRRPALETCATAREWLDAKRHVSAEEISDSEVHHLLDVVKNGRFLDEGDRSVVVREAAAMMLGRYLQQREMEQRRAFTDKHKVATAEDQQYLWDLVAKTAGLASD